MTLQDRDRRALKLLAVVVPLALIYWLISSSGGSSATKVVAPVDNIDHAQKRLASVRSAAATLDARQALLTQVSSEVAAREKGLLAGDTADQAQAQLLQVLRRVAKLQTPPLDIRQVELGQPRAFGAPYGLVTASVTIDCRIEELVNYLSTLSAQPELIATEDIRLSTANARQKVIAARLTVSGIVPRRLVPERKGPQL